MTETQIIPNGATVQLQMPNQDHLFEHVQENRQYCTKVVPPDFCEGKTVVICGAGPSLALHHDEIRSIKAHMVWACNSALPYMVKHDMRPTHGVTVDQSPEMYTQDWKETYNLKYLISSGVSPDLVRHLLAAKRDIRFFHSYLGIPNPEGWTRPLGWQPPIHQPNAGYEMWLYQTLWPATVQVGYGLNSVPRAICLAMWAKAKKIIVYGADCACAPDQTEMPAADTDDYVPWLKTLKLYADGRNPAECYGDKALMAEGRIDGRLWHTRPDMLISARHMYDLVRMYPQIELRGDTLPNAIKDKTPEWLDVNIPRLNGSGAVEGFGLKTRLDTQRSA